jgi:transaldolase
MQLFIDSADLNEIREAAAWGTIDGVTTNPSLIAKNGGDFAKVIASICSIVDGPVSAECVEVEAAAMVAEGKRIAAMHANIVVKVPLTQDGLKCVKQLTDANIRTNVTLCFSTAQGLMAAKAGATYISPFIGRLDDLAYDGMQVVRELCDIYQRHNLRTQVLAASIRHPRHVVDAALAGAHVATVPFKILRQLTAHPLTDIGVQQFLADWQRVPKPA